MDRRMSVALGLTLALVATSGCASGRIRGATTRPVPPPATDVQVAVADTSSGAAHAHAPAGSGTSQAAADVVGQLEFHAFDLGFDPMAVTVDAPGTYAITFINDGSILHDLTFDDGTVLSADPGATVTGEVVVPAEGIGFICSIPGHKEAGMTGAISVTASAPAETAAPASTSPDDHGGPLPDNGITPDPNAPAPVTYDAQAPARLEGEVHDIELVDDREADDGRSRLSSSWSGPSGGPCQDRSSGSRSATPSASTS